MPDGSLVPWTSPVNGIPMRIAGAAPDIPWSDLAYSLTPNGQKLDYVADPAYNGRMGIEKESFNNGLYATVNPLGAGLYCGEAPYPSPCTDFAADVTVVEDAHRAGRALRRRSCRAGGSRRDQGAPLRLLHRPLRAAGAAADLERLRRRPLPRRTRRSATTTGSARSTRTRRSRCSSAISGTCARSTRRTSPMRSTPRTTPGSTSTSRAPGRSRSRARRPTRSPVRRPRHPAARTRRAAGRASRTGWFASSTAAARRSRRAADRRASMRPSIRFRTEPVGTPARRHRAMT